MLFVFCDLRKHFVFAWARWSPAARALISSPLSLQGVLRAAGGRSRRLTCRCLVGALSKPKIDPPVVDGTLVVQSITMAA